MNDLEYQKHISQWFNIMEANGEKTEILFFQQSNENTKITEFSHKEYDGIGALLELNRKLGGITLSAPILKITKPSWRILIGFFNYLKESALYFFPWKRKKVQWGQPNAPVGFDLQGEEYSKCIEICKRESISLNTLLIYLVNQTVLKLQPQQSTPAKWLIPINMRGYVNQSRSTAHHSSYIVVRCLPQTSAQSIHQQIKWQLAHGLHFFSWWGLFIDKILGKSSPQKIMNNYHQEKHSWTGTISNLGRWPGSELDKQHWYFTPPVTYAHPLAIGLIEFENRISVGILTHQSLDPKHFGDEFKTAFKQQLMILN